MSDIERKTKELGARRKRLRDELRDIDSELRATMPAIRSAMTYEDIRASTGLSIQTIRAYSAGGR
ncbi:hypothetical protein ACOZDZ_18005 [Streptomyces griseoincarnatus]|uniref:hypothetical protein n=1 Tax=Streptomyces sp. E2N171 TaxID=1851914 RepID=UPI000EF5DFD9|nr:hypothetical protein [Streptomyces sp. E2N171]